jgi:hypothetical protein
MERPVTVLHLAMTFISQVAHMILTPSMDLRIWGMKWLTSTNSGDWELLGLLLNTSGNT